MKISILTPDFSENCFGRAWSLAKLLQSSYDIEVIGPASGESIWHPLANSCDFDMKIAWAGTRGLSSFRKMLPMITGNVIYASKPVMASFGLSLVKKISSGKPVVLDIDDWELAPASSFYNSLPWYKKINDYRLSITNWHSYYYAVLLNKLIFLSDAVTVAGKTLQNRFGGTIIWHARDHNTLDPQKYNQTQLREVYLPTRDRHSFLVGFIGTPRPHKGLEDLIDSIGLLRSTKVLLLLVGVQDDNYSSKLREKVAASGLEDRVCFLPPQPFAKLPEILSIIDLKVIPQRKRPASLGQVPAKIFDAMSMAKPIIATNVFDIPEILNGCGFVIEPENPSLLADSIQYVLDNPDVARQMGVNAREKIEKEYSWEATENNLKMIFSKYS
jgi:glycosyltransferase involved in cell wall biosynthesis